MRLSPSVQSAILGYLADNSIVETSIPAVVRATGVKASPGASLRAFVQSIGKLLLDSGFKRHRPMLQGVRGYRYTRSPSANPPPKHDRPLSPSEIVSWAHGPRPDPYQEAQKMAEIAARRRERRAPLFSVYVPEPERSAIQEAAKNEGLSASAYILTLVRLARPHCPPGAVRAAAEAAGLAPLRADCRRGAD